MIDPDAPQNGDTPRRITYELLPNGAVNLFVDPRMNIGEIAACAAMLAWNIDKRLDAQVSQLTPTLVRAASVPDNVRDLVKPS